MKRTLLNKRETRGERERAPTAHLVMPGVKRQVVGGLRGRRRHLDLLRVLVQLLADETISFFLFFNVLSLLLLNVVTAKIKLTLALVLLAAAVCQSRSNAMGTRWSELSSSPPPSRLPLLLPAELPSDRSRLCSSPPVASASHAQ
jgi:hypothetical protein